MTACDNVQKSKLIVRILLANSSRWGELTKNRRKFGQNWGQDAVQSAESHGLWGENR
jgi:hypothetical protein